MEKTQPSTLKKKLNIFLSYGHDIEPFASRIKKELEDMGHVVWRDSDFIRTGSDWAEKIRDALKTVCSDKENGRFLLLLTPHINRKEDEEYVSVTYNEIQEALGVVDIFPVMVKETELPFLLNNKQFLDFTDCFPAEANEGKYREKLTLLAEALITRSRKGFDYFMDKTLEELADPDSKAVPDHHVNFTGRKWLFNDTLEWLENGREPVYCIEGDAGSGKTAFSAHLCKNLQKLKAFHFIKYDAFKSFNKEAQPNLRKCFHNLLYQLCKNTPSFWNVIKNKESYHRLQSDKNKQTAENPEDSTLILKNLILHPLKESEIEENKQIIVILIDALDELFRNERELLISTFINNSDLLSDRLRFILTTRPGSERIRRNKTLFKIRSIDRDSEDNEHDLKDYIRSEFRQFNRNGEELDPKVVDIIYTKSEGIFLYLRWLQQEYEGRQDQEQTISVEHAMNLPQGLSEQIGRFFEREYPDLKMYQKHIKKIIAISFAAQQAFSVEEISQILSDPDLQAEDCARMLGTLFLCEGEKIVPFHKSVYDWVSDKDKAVDYYVDVREGHEILAQKGEEVRTKIHGKNIIENRSLSILESKLIDELAYHQISLSRIDRLKETLTEIGLCVRFYENKPSKENNLSKLQLLTYFNKIPDKKQLIEPYLNQLKNYERLNSNREAAKAYHVVGLLFFHASIFLEAVCFFEEAISLYKKESKEERKKKIALLYNDLGEVYYNESHKLSEAGDDESKSSISKYCRKAKRYYQQSIDIREKELGHYHKDTAESINNLGHAFLGLGKMDESERQYVTAFEIRKKVLPEQHRDLAEGYFNVGVIQTLNHKQSKEKYMEGIENIRKAISINDHAFSESGDERHDQALNHDMLASRYKSLNDLDKAIDHLEISVILYIRFYGVYNEKSKKVFGEYENLYLEMKRMMLERTPGLFNEHLLQDSLDNRLAMVPENSTEIIIIHIIFATVFLNNGFESEAEVHLREANTRVSKLLKEKDRSETEINAVVEYYLKNARMFIYHTQYDKAGDQISKAFDIRKAKSEDTLHKVTLDIYVYLVRIYLSIHVMKRAEAATLIDLMLEKSTEIERQFVIQGKSPDPKLYEYLAIPYNEIAFHMYVPGRDWEKAEASYKKAIELVKKCGNEVEIANMEINLQTVYFQSGQKTDLDKVANCTQILEKAKDSRAGKGRMILSGVKNESFEILLKLSFAVAASDGDIDESEIKMIRKILRIDENVSFNRSFEAILSSWKEKKGDFHLFTNDLIGEAIEKTEAMELSPEDIHRIIEQALIISAADLHVRKEELNAIHRYANHFGITKQEISGIFNKLNYQ